MDARTGRRLVLYSGHTGTISTLAWLPDGTRIVSGSDDSTVQVWDANSGHLGSIWAVAWSPDGKHIASGGNDSTVQVWDGASGRRLLTYPGHTAPVRAVVW